MVLTDKDRIQPMNVSERHPNAQKALIIGGGIGGLAAAIALQEVGFDVEVYEQAEALREVGAGLTIWRNGLEALDVLGGHEAAVWAGAILEHTEIRTPGGTLLNEVHPRSVLSTDSDSPPGLGLHRADLQRILRDRVGDGVVHLGYECVGVEEDDDQVTARFSSGKEVRDDVLIGADGLHSAVRASLHGETEPRFSGIGI